MTDRPLTDDELRQLGYERRSDGGWRLVDPTAKPPPRPGLCRFCQKFDAAADGWCWGCLYFGPGDPHGIKALQEKPARRAVDQPRLSPAERLRRAWEERHR